MTKPGIENIGKACLELNRDLIEKAGGGKNAYMPRDPNKPNKADIKAEKDLQRLAEQELSRRGIVGFHIPPSERCKKGWPDLVFAHPSDGVATGVELKLPKTKLTPEQKALLTRMRKGKWYVAVVRSFDQFLAVLDGPRIEGEIA